MRAGGGGEDSDDVSARGRPGGSLGSAPRLAEVASSKLRHRRLPLSVMPMTIMNMSILSVVVALLLSAASPPVVGQERPSFRRFGFEPEPGARIAVAAPMRSRRSMSSTGSQCSNWSPKPPQLFVRR